MGESNEFVILKYVKNEPKNKCEYLYATFLCQFNKNANFLKNTWHKDVNERSFFDYSHKFLLQIPIYVTAKLSLSNLAVLSGQNNLEKTNFERLISFIVPDDLIVKSAPETNQQPIIECFILTATTWEDYEFFKKIQSLYNCFYDFEFIDFEQYLYIILNINPGLVYNFNNIANRINTFHYCNLRVGKFSSSNFIKYIFNCKCNGTAKEYRVSINSFLKDEPNALLSCIEKSVLTSWTSVTYDIECGRIEKSEFKNQETGALTNPLDSYVQTICCVVPKDPVKELKFNLKSLDNFNFNCYVFVFVPDKSFKKEFLEYKLKNKHISMYLFDEEQDMLCASLLFLSMFNQINDMNGLNFDLPFIVHRLNILRNNLSNLNYISIGWPFSIQSSIMNEIKILCKCKYLNNRSDDLCKRCKQSLDKKNSTLFTFKFRKGFTNFPLSVHLDLQYLDWKPNLDLKEKTNSSSLASLSTFWFKQKICYYNYLPSDNLLVFYSTVKNLSNYHDLVVGFGKQGHELIWFNYLQSNALIKNYSSRLLKTDFFFIPYTSNNTDCPYGTNRHDVECLKPISHYPESEFDFDTQGVIAFYVAINSSQIIPTVLIGSDHICPPKINNERMVINENVPANSYVSFTKLEIDSFKQRNPSCSQDYIDLVEYCIIDTILTAHLTMISKNHIYCLGSKTYRLPTYMAYTAKSGNIANYIDCCSKYDNYIQTKNMDKYNQYILFETCNLLGKKTDNNERSTEVMTKHGKAFKFAIAKTIPDLFSGHLNISECNLNLIGEKPINTIKNMEEILDNMISRKN
jgi:hypothetical protein